MVPRHAGAHTGTGSALTGDAQILWQQPGAIDISGIPSPDGRRVAVWVRARHANLWLAEIP